jgi:hypothetical protein
MNSVYGLIGLLLAASAPTGDVGGQETIKVHTDSPIYATGSKLLAACTADPKTTNGQEVCQDYIGGVVDTISSNRDTIQGYIYCWPNPGPDLSELRVMFVQYMHDHPNFSDGIAASIIDTMLFDKYRCPGAHAPGIEDLKGIVPGPAPQPR